jgi:hypothetical protein
LQPPPGLFKVGRRGTKAEILTLNSVGQAGFEQNIC